MTRRPPSRSDEPAPRGSWEPFATADGSPSLRHPVHGQACHSTDGAWLEARERYAAACELERRARECACESSAGVVRLMDIGTGLGWNLAAALEAVDGAGARLEAVGFELADGPIAAALELESAPGHPWEPWWGRVRAALAAALQPSEEPPPPRALTLGPASCGGEHSLLLFLGDARERLQELPERADFDACFLDPFSPGVEGALWQDAFLAGMARRLAPGAWLSTYTSSLAVRTALAAAGLRVGPGPRVGHKASGTRASPDRDPGALDPRTARKLARRLERRSPPTASE